MTQDGTAPALVAHPSIHGNLWGRGLSANWGLLSLISLQCEPRIHEPYRAGEDIRN